MFVFSNWFYSFFGHAQGVATSDSFQVLVELAKTDHEKVDHLLNWCRYQKYARRTDTLVKNAISLIPSIQNDSLIGRIWAVQATILRNQRLYDSAAIYNVRAFEAFKKSRSYSDQIIQLSQLGFRELYINDNGTKADSFYRAAENITNNFAAKDNILLRVYQGRGLAKSSAFKYDEAVDFFLKAEKYLDTTDHRWFKTFYHNFGHVYDVMGDDEKAISIFQKVIDKCVQVSDYDGLAFSSRSSAGILLRQKKYKEAEKHFLSAVVAFDSTGDEQRKAWTISEMAQMYGKMGELEKSLEASEYALEYARKYNIKNEIAWSLAMIGFYHLEIKNPRQAIVYCEEAWDVIKEVENRGTKMNVCECLVEAYEKLGNYKKAHEFNKFFHTWSDSTSGENQIREIARIETKYQLEKSRTTCAAGTRKAAIGL